MAVEHINQSQVDELTKDGIKVVNITGVWCGPCKMFAPILEEASNELPVYKVDVDQNREYAQKMQIRGVPSTFIYKDGEVVDTVVGFVPKETLMQRINAAR